MRNRIAVAIAVALLVPWFSSDAATFIVPSDRELVGKARAIVVGTVTDTHSELSPTGGPITVSTIAVDDAIKGGFHRGETLSVSELGGAVGDTILVVPGAPNYAPGDRVLLFLDRNGRGDWSTLDMVLGKFNFMNGKRGERLLVREEREIHGWSTRGRPWNERPRRQDEFLKFVRDVAQGNVADENYISSDSPATTDVTPVSSSSAAGTYAASAYLTTLTVNGVTRPARWSSFGSGIAFYNHGSQVGWSDGGVGAIQAGCAAWTNDSGSNVNYRYGGTTAATYGLNSFDSVNSVQFNDPNGEITGSFTGSGVLGIGGVWINGTTHTYNGETFYGVTQGDVVIQDGVSPTNLGASKMNQLLAHELGHTLGFRHSDQGTPSSTAAIMRASIVTDYGAVLQAYDLDAVRTVYGSGTAPAPLTVSSLSATHGASSGTTLTINGSGFQSGAAVTVGGIAAPSVTVNSSTSITITTPLLTGGTVNNVIVSSGGSTATVPQTFFANYADVAESYALRNSIEIATRRGIVVGCGGGKYCPDTLVPRGQMAVFILRGKYGGSYSPPAATGTMFSDVSTSTFAANFIERLAAESITTGCGGGRYCPTGTTTRQQIAVFLIRARHGSSYVPPAATGALFSDVPVTSTYAPFIEQLSRDGGVSSCGSGVYCPGNGVSRAQMADFIVKTFGLTM